MKRLCAVPLLTGLLLISPGAQAAYWVEAISGSTGTCHLLRDGKRADLRVLMRLQVNDRITLADDCSVVLVGADNDRVSLTFANSPYRVPAAQPAPSALQNVEDWVVSWFSSPSEKAAEKVLVVSRGPQTSPAPVLLAAVDSERNMLLAGTRSLEVRWTGGAPPYLVTLTSVAGHVVSRAAVTSSGEAGQEASRASLNLPELHVADYELRVKAAESAQSVRIAIVPANREPGIASALSTPGVPESIRQSYRAIALGSLYEWRFQALQIAAAYHLDAILDRLVLGDFPEPPVQAPAKVP